MYECLPYGFKDVGIKVCDIIVYSVPCGPEAALFAVGEVWNNVYCRHSGINQRLMIVGNVATVIAHEIVAETNICRA